MAQPNEMQTTEQVGQGDIDAYLESQEGGSGGSTDPETPDPGTEPAADSASSEQVPTEEPSPADGESEPEPGSVPPTEEWDGNIRDLLGNQEWVQAHPDLAKNLKGIQAHSTQTWQEAADTKKQLQTTIQQVERLRDEFAKGEGELFNRAYDERLKREIQETEREEQIEKEEAEYRRLIEEEGFEAAERFRERQANRALQTEMAAMRQQFESLQQTMEKGERQRQFLAEEAKFMQKAMKQHGLNEELARVARSLYLGEKNSGYNTSEDAAIGYVKKWSAGTAKPKEKGGNLTDALNRGIENAKNKPRPKGGLPAATSKKRIPLGQPGGADQAVAELRAAGLVD